MSEFKSPALTIIIVNWNSADYALECVRSISEQTSEVTYEAIVVDNASYDECGERLAKEHPEVKFIQSKANLGFARANNLGASHAKGNVLLFLNPDTELRNKAIDRLYANFNAIPDAGAVGCRLINSNGSLQTSCVQALPTILNQVLDAEVLRRRFPKSGLWGMAALYEQGGEPAEVEAVSGACLMIGRKVFEKVGGFSTDYFMYGEDLDLCFKTRRAGLKNYFVGEAAIVHHGGGSSNQKRNDFSIVMMRESVKRFLRKSHGGSYSAGYQAALSLVALIRLAVIAVLVPIYLVRGRTAHWVASFSKWLAIIRWGFGLERWTRNYDGVDEEVRCPEGGKVKSCAGSAEN